MKPTPMVMALSVSLTIRDLINIRNNPVHMNNTTSTDGSLSDAPNKSASSDGTVAQ